MAVEDETRNSNEKDKEFNVKAAIFLSGVSGISALIGFGATLASAKKQDPKYFGIGMTPSKELSETGASLALRALGWGTLYAFVGCGVLFYSIWKLSGATDKPLDRSCSIYTASLICYEPAIELGLS
ncbi:transmembrane protein 242 isoform X2 [Diorhabda sublineata]|uniref:transmembrane protein 242 isoform X2 n=1 Tax=Diorhabda sublineata TaxID=1163346 RepID=UPI0024E152BE|nr:transmembrane protein 242 isoform X2 [Diorhabda sublineata]